MPFFGEEHPETRKAQHKVENYYRDYDQKGLKSDLELAEKVYALRCRILGEEHRVTLRALDSIALIYRDRNEHQKALELFEKVYGIRCRVLGEGASETRASLE